MQNNPSIVGLLRVLKDMVLVDDILSGLWAPFGSDVSVSWHGTLQFKYQEEQTLSTENGC